MLFSVISSIHTSSNPLPMILSGAGYQILSAPSLSGNSYFENVLSSSHFCGAFRIWEWIGQARCFHGGHYGTSGREVEDTIFLSIFLNRAKRICERATGNR